MKRGRRLRGNPADVHQRRTRQNWRTTWPFVLLAALAGLGVVDAANQPNHSAQRQGTDWPWDTQFPDAGTMVTVLVASIGWLVGRSHHALSMQPLLSVESESVEDNKSRLKDAKNFREVCLVVGGKGALIVRNVRWRVQLRENDVATFKTMEDLRTYLRAKANLLEGMGHDYVFANVRPGTSWDLGKTILYFNARDEAVAKFEQFEAILEFDSMVGDRFRRGVDLLPHVDRPNVVVAAEAEAAV